MRYAKGYNDEAIEPEYSGQLATCFCCGAEVRGKCGAINAWHWAHEAGDCDSFAEAITGWHVGWQDFLREEHGARLEHVGERDGQRHRADALLPSGTVVELQHSSLSAGDIQAREGFWGVRSLLWVFDARDAFQADRLTLRPRDGFWTFRWKQPRRSLGTCKARIDLHLGGGWVCRIKRLYTEAPCGGWGLLRRVTGLESVFDEDMEEWLDVPPDWY